MTAEHLSFTASVISGEGHGRKIGFPTLNLALSEVPKALASGVYIAQIKLDGEGEWLPAALFRGERKTLGFVGSCEVHIINDNFQFSISQFSNVNIEVIERIRDVEHFDSTEELQAAIAKDIDSIALLESEIRGSRDSN